MKQGELAGRRDLHGSEIFEFKDNSKNTGLLLTHNDVGFL